MPSFTVASDLHYCSKYDAGLSCRCFAVLVFFLLSDVWIVKLSFFMHVLMLFFINAILRWACCVAFLRLYFTVLWSVWLHGFFFFSVNRSYSILFIKYSVLFWGPRLRESVVSKTASVIKLQSWIWICVHGKEQKKESKDNINIFKMVGLKLEVI